MPGASLTDSWPIAGRIVDADGLPAGKVSVSAFPSSFTTKKEFPEVSMQTMITDADGRYEIGPLPPGEYQVGVNVEREPRLDSPYPPTYHRPIPLSHQPSLSFEAQAARRSGTAKAGSSKSPQSYRWQASLESSGRLHHHCSRRSARSSRYSNFRKMASSFATGWLPVAAAPLV